MRITDIGMIAYWGITALAASSLLSLPTEWLFKDYHSAHAIAWNWSFFPLDIALSISGLAALRLERRNDPRWQLLTVISLVLTVTAGAMAVAYWAVAKDFSLSWWLPNLFLILWPLPFLTQMLRKPR